MTGESDSAEAPRRLAARTSRLRASASTGKASTVSKAEARRAPPRPPTRGGRLAGDAAEPVEAAPDSARMRAITGAAVLAGDGGSQVRILIGFREAAALARFRNQA